MAKSNPLANLGHVLGWPPRLRPVGGTFGRSGAWGGSVEGGREEFRWVLPELGFQLADALVEGEDQRLGGAQGHGPDLRRQGQFGQFHELGYTASPPVLQPPVSRRV